MPEPIAPSSRAAELAELTTAFGRLGLTSFGGPVAHLGYIRTEIVTRRQWLNDEAYADLVALCQFLPGPASSQVVFGAGMLRAGWLGGVVASICFTLPSAIIMIAGAYSLSRFAGEGSKWLHGLMLAAVAVVAQAVWGMGKTLCPDRERFTLCVIAAALLLVIPGVMMQLLVMLGGCAFGLLWYGSDPSVQPPTEPLRRSAVARSLACLALFVLLLAGLQIVAHADGSSKLGALAMFYRTGACVFGGGHVVLPLLSSQMQQHAWVTSDTILTGYGLAQALPGPLFTFAGFLGAAMPIWHWRWLGGVLSMLALFMPGFLLLAAALPHWHWLRSRPMIRVAMTGTNAAVVGVLLAALYDPIAVHTLHTTTDIALAAVGFLLLTAWRVSPVIVVAGLTITAQLLY